MSPVGNKPVIRQARAGDHEAVLRIYNHYVASSHATFDIHTQTLEERRSWFGRFRASGPYRLWVAEHAGDVCGYACSTRLRPKPAYDVSVETTVYVTPEAQGCGLGKRLYDALLESLESAGLHRAFAAIALPNPASIALHEQLGFRCVGCFDQAGFKFGRYWDIAWYARALTAD